MDEAADAAGIDGLNMNDLNMQNEKLSEDVIRPVVLLGPTAGGKSELAVHLAERLGGEVISADSMQVYRHMDAGTAKPSHELRARAKHHLIDCVEPTERFTVADWLNVAEPLIDSLIARGKVPVVVGGTNLYLKALLEGIFDGPDHDEQLRAELALLDNPQLHARLAAIDAESARRIHLNDRKKLVRAIEVTMLTGKPLSQQQTQWDWSWSGPAAEGENTAEETEGADSFAGNGRPAGTQRGVSRAAYLRDPVLIGLEWPVDEINRRINLRVKLMFFPEKAAAALAAANSQPVVPGQGQADMGLSAGSFASTLTPQGDPTVLGLVDEVRGLLAQDKLGLQAREALGYKQVIDHLQGRMSLDDAFEKTKILTRRFAKTQRTWLKRFRGVTWLNPTVLSPVELAEQAVEAAMKKKKVS